MATQRLLGRVLGEIEVAQDPARDGEEPRRDGGGHQAEGLSVAVLGPFHELGIHALIRNGGDGTSDASYGMGGCARPAFKPAGED